MTKVTFNQAGLDTKRQMLRSLSPDEFAQQMELVQHQTASWCIDNFILKDEQVEYLHAMPKLMIDYIGIHARVAFESGGEFILETPVQYTPPMAAKRPVKPYVKGGGTWTPSTGQVNMKWEVGFKLSFG